MQDLKNIIDCYNKTATNYGEKFKNELDGKHLDRLLLKAFAEENITRGNVIDLGCGPGQTTQFLYEAGLTNCIGTDLSPEMVKVAQRLHPGLMFETADILNLQFPDDSFASAIAFYSIVHFTYDQIKIALKEISRIF